MTGARATNLRSSSCRALADGSGMTLVSSQPDSTGLVIGRSEHYASLLEHVVSTEWRGLIQAAIEADRLFVGCGQPFRADGTGFYAIARSVDHLAAAINIAHERIRDHGAKWTTWFVIADPVVEKVAYDALAKIMPTEGCA